MHLTRLLHLNNPSDFEALHECPMSWSSSLVEQLQVVEEVNANALYRFNKLDNPVDESILPLAPFIDGSKISKQQSH